MGVFCKRRIRVSNLSLGWTIYENDRGCFCKFQTKQGDYAADQALYTVEAKSYEPNGYNLYNMAGIFRMDRLFTTLMHMNMFPQ
jgi:hypothetical protein